MDLCSKNTLLAAKGGCICTPLTPPKSATVEVCNMEECNFLLYSLSFDFGLAQSLATLVVMDSLPPSFQVVDFDVGLAQARPNNAVVVHIVAGSSLVQRRSRERPWNEATTMTSYT